MTLAKHYATMSGQDFCMKDFSPSPLTTTETMLSCFIRIKSLHENDTITNSGEISSC